MASINRQVRWPFLVAAAAAAIVVTTSIITPKVQDWRHDRAERGFHSAVTRLELPPGIHIDPTGSSCEFIGSLCVTSAGSAVQLVDSLREPLARRGVRLEAGCPMQDFGIDLDSPLLGGRGARCSAAARSAGAVLSVQAAEGALLPGDPAPRSSASLMLLTDAEPVPRERPASLEQVRAVLPPGFELRFRTSSEASTAVGSFTLTVPPPVDASFDRLADHLRSQGFRVERGDMHDTRGVAAHRYTADHTGIDVLVLGRTTEALMSVSTVAF